MSYLLQGAVNVKAILFLDPPLGTFTLVAGVILLAYDVIINLSSEVELIWHCRWSFGKLLYVLARYSGSVDAAAILYYVFATNLTAESCHIAFGFIEWCFIIGVAICHCVLVVRTFVIWERNFFILAYISLIQAAGIAVKVYVIAQAGKQTTFTLSPIPTIAACIPSAGTGDAFITFCVDVAFEFRE
ncbi:hypothetical protein SCHPADRAFT_943168 [Schizopora paradoxa]|uniref:DUF6533 domain-containing protein n=1 Tax=Schizopora paradoxa TaxID=27342 RepID=A0A0H2RDT3_9AGAM|nr:hypothetical protein SCHPADRAFT_943168 [Schizopora paradoxa]